MKPSMAPEADKNCTKCRTCVKVCPVHAINSETPRKTDKEVHYVYRLYRKLYSKKHGLLAGRNTLSHQNFLPALAASVRAGTIRMTYILKD